MASQKLAIVTEKPRSFDSAVGVPKALPPSFCPMTLSATMHIHDQSRTVPSDVVMRRSWEEELSGLRIFIAMSPPTDTEWMNLVNRKKAEFSELLDLPDFETRHEFIRALERAADERDEPDIQTNLNRLGRSYMRVERFANVIGGQSKQIKQEELLKLVWDSSFLVFEHGFSARRPFQSLVRHISHIDDHLPLFENLSDVLLDVPALQEPLQAIYTRYLDSFLNVIQVMGKDDQLTVEEQDEVIMRYARLSIERFEEEKRDYVRLRKVVKQTAHWVGGHNAAPAVNFQRTEDRPLGRGTYGKVYKVREVSTNQLYAHKRITVGSGSSQISSSDMVANEMNIMRKLSHHHITTLAFSTKDSQGYSLYILPVAQCSLGDYLNHFAKYSYNKSQVQRWCGCLSGALDYAHRNGVKHKDIKPTNILIDENGDRALLTDFGLARDFSESGVSRTSGPHVVGTPKYFAPECTPTGERTKAVDIFALGCVFAEILNAMAGRSQEEFNKIRRGWGSEEFRNCLDEVRAAVNKQVDAFKYGNDKSPIASQTFDMLARDAYWRPTAENVHGRFEDFHLHCDKCER